MFKNMPTWLKHFWAVIGGLAVLIGAFAGIADLVGFFEERNETSMPPPTAIPTITPIPTNTPIPTPMPTPTLGEIQFLLFPEAFKAGEDVKIVALAWVGAACFLEYYTPDGSLSSADGLGLVIGDSQGHCVWEWHISANTKPGEGRLEISINDFEQTMTIQIVAGN
jgi:hypothetical protein